MNSQVPHAAASGGAIPYSPPPFLEAVQVVDLLELSGSQHAAASVLAIHQSTVSRCLRSLQEHLRLRPVTAAAVCRHGRNDCLDLLRLACRAHRLMQGVLRIGTDCLHQPLLHRQPGLHLVPPSFRPLDHWAELVRAGVLDGALVSSWGLHEPLPQDGLPCWSGIQVQSLGCLPLQLVAAVACPQAVLLPSRAATPLLHQLLEQQGHRLVSQPRAAQDPADWLKHMRDRELSLPLCPPLLGEAWMRDEELHPVAHQPCLQERIWLLLPDDWPQAAASLRVLHQLRRRATRAAALPCEPLPAAGGDSGPQTRLAVPGTPELRVGNA